MSSALEQWRAAWFQAVALAWKDDNFKQALLNNPRDAIKTQFGFEFPLDGDLTVVETGGPGPTLGATQLVLPPKPPNVDEETTTVTDLARALADTTVTCIC